MVSFLGAHRLERACLDSLVLVSFNSTYTYPLSIDQSVTSCASLVCSPSQCKRLSGHNQEGVSACLRICAANPGSQSTVAVQQMLSACNCRVNASLRGYCCRTLACIQRFASVRQCHQHRAVIDPEYTIGQS